jgi:hypothetical protein
MNVYQSLSKEQSDIATSTKAKSIMDIVNGDKWEKKFISNFFNSEIGRLELIDPNQRKYLLRAYNDKKAPGKYTIGMVKQYLDGEVIKDENGDALLKKTRGEHIRTLQIAYNKLVPVINEAAKIRGTQLAKPVIVNGDFDENFREAIKIFQNAGDLEYTEGFVGRETLHYMDKALYNMENKQVVEPTPQEKEINKTGFRKEILDAFEIAFREDVRRRADLDIEEYEKLLDDNAYLSATEIDEIDNSPITTVKRVNYKGALMGDSDVNVYDGQMNIYGEKIDVNIQFKRGANKKTNTIGSINHIGKDITFQDLGGSFNKIEGHVFRVSTSPYDVRILFRSQVLTQDDAERTMAFVSMDDDNLRRLFAKHDEISAQMVRKHFRTEGTELEYWRAKARKIFFNKIQPFYYTYYNKMSYEVALDEIVKQPFFGDYLTAMTNYYRLDPKAYTGDSKKTFDLSKKKYDTYQKQL